MASRHSSLFSAVSSSIPRSSISSSMHLLQLFFGLPAGLLPGSYLHPHRSPHGAILSPSLHMAKPSQSVPPQLALDVFPVTSPQHLLTIVVSLFSPTLVFCFPVKFINQSHESQRRRHIKWCNEGLYLFKIFSFQ